MGPATVGPEDGPGPAGPALKPKERSLLLSAADVEETQSAKAPESDANLRVDATTAACLNPHLRINEKWVRLIPGVD